MLTDGSARIAVALGSNLGDREQILQHAVAALRLHIPDLRVSTFHDTAPVGLTEQPRFLNAAAVGSTSLSPHECLGTLLAIERQFGRVRSTPNAPRTLDLDLILYADLIIDEPGLVVPHPRFRERAFVLAPLAEIAPGWADPVTRVTIENLRAKLTHRG